MHQTATPAARIMIVTQVMATKSTMDTTGIHMAIPTAVTIKTATTTMRLINGKADYCSNHVKGTFKSTTMTIIMIKATKSSLKPIATELCNQADEEDSNEGNTNADSDLFVNEVKNKTNTASTTTMLRMTTVNRRRPLEQPQRQKCYTNEEY